MMNSEMSSEAFHVSHAEWNSLMHALHGNTVTKTKTTEATKTTPTTAKSILDPPTKPSTKPKAKAKAGPGRSWSAAAKSAALKTTSKPRGSKLAGADVDKPAAKAAAKRASKPKMVKFQALRGRLSPLMKC